jgi:uncharacterized membrane protein YagU involved in acid resistance
MWAPTEAAMFGDSFAYCLSNIAEFLFSADATGYIASFLVLATFSMRRMVPLRIVAIFSNIAFLEYGSSLGLKPIALLHGLLLPINVCRLAQAYDVSIPETISKLFRSAVVIPSSPVVHFARVSAISALLITAANSSITKDADSDAATALFHWQVWSSSCSASLTRTILFSTAPDCPVRVH